MTTTIGPNTIAPLYPQGSQDFNLVHGAGLWWIFYQPSVHGWYYKTSADGINFSAPTLLTNPYDGNSLDMQFWFDGARLHYVHMPTGYSQIKYRMGTLNQDGTITWAAAEQLVDAGYTFASGLGNLICASDGYPIVSYDYTPAFAVHYVKIVKSTTKNGTWNGVTLYDATSAGAGSHGLIIPLQNAKLYRLVVYTNSMKGALYDAGWQAEESLELLSCYYPDITNRGDRVDIIYLKGAGFDVYHGSRNPGTATWTTTLLEASTVSTNVPHITSQAGHLIAFWPRTDTNKIFYRLFDGSSWAAKVDWIDETLDPFIYIGPQMYYANANRQVGFLYLIGSGLPYILRFAILEPTFLPKIGNVMGDIHIDQLVFRHCERIK